jgi:N-acetyltransferase
MLIKNSIEGLNINLIKFDKSHSKDLFENASIDPSIWNHLSIAITTESDFEKYLNLMNESIIDGRQFTFSIFHKAINTFIGSTSILNIDEKNKKVEIGWTWINSIYWGSKINMECKYLLIDYLFTSLNIQRIELRTRESNIRSQKAIEKIGATKEAVIRCDRINEDGSFRNTVLYSLIRSEWDDLKHKIKTNLSSF